MRNLSRICLSFALLHAPLLTLGGCGEYVAYDDGPARSVAVRTPGAGDLDEATRVRYAALTTLDHLALESLLAEYVVVGDDARVDYARLAASPEATDLLQGYLAMLDVVAAAQLASPAERQAYWYNAYNAAVLQGVLLFWEGDPTYSVSAQAFLFFDQPIWSFGGQILTLNQIEHGLLRGDFAHSSLADLSTAQRSFLEATHADTWGDAEPDARLHVALNCASVSCPDLGAATPRAFRAATLDTQLTALARRFVDQPGKGAGPAGISSLFSWYAADFDRVGGAEAFIEAHRSGGLDGVRTDRLLDYDWQLNALP